jgi:hypothetical protein
VQPYDWYAAALSAWGSSCHCHSFCVWRFDRTMVRPNPSLVILVLVWLRDLTVPCSRGTAKVFLNNNNRVRVYSIDID